ncbi:MAG TPA: serine hydrolase domain-containing protein, partial [Cytophagaceae bacterium]|nr:serine hydrolase domain-containing protein [Cytophagaceae bacterium]
MKNNSLILLFFSILLFSHELLGQTFNKPKMDSLFDVLSEKNKAMGSLAISKNSKMIYERSIGYSFIADGSKIAATADTKYRIGSITKTFTAVMIFQLIEEEKLSLSTTMDRYFPSLPNAKKITVSNLLNHRSGLHNFTDRADYEAWAIVPKKEKTMMNTIAKGGADFEPGTKASYSNSNYYVLGYLIEKITKQSYAKNLEERITSKVGLKNTYVGGKTDLKKQESLSYQFIDNKWIPKTETSISVTGGAGCMVSTPADLTKFIEALFQLQLVNANSLTTMKTMTDGYGMGILLLPFETKKSYGHTGGIDGFASVMTYFTKDSLAVAYCSNGQVYSRNDILLGVLNIYYDLDYSIP